MRYVVHSVLEDWARLTRLASFFDHEWPFGQARVGRSGPYCHVLGAIPTECRCWSVGPASAHFRRRRSGLRITLQMARRSMANTAKVCALRIGVCSRSGPPSAEQIRPPPPKYRIPLSPRYVKGGGEGDPTFGSSERSDRRASARSPEKIRIASEDSGKKWPGAPAKWPARSPAHPEIYRGHAQAVNGQPGKPRILTASRAVEALPIASRY